MNSTRPLKATFNAKIYRDIKVNDRDVWFDAFQEQRTMTKFALHGWRRFNKAAHLLPLYDKRLNELDDYLTKSFTRERVTTETRVSPGAKYPGKQKTPMEVFTASWFSE